MENINLLINKLVKYGLDKKLFTEDDKIYVTNQLLEKLKIDEFEEIQINEKLELENIIEAILDYGFEKGLIENNTSVYRDLFDSKIMNCLMPRPSEVRETFWKEYKKSPIEATNYFYSLSRNSNYIKTYRVKKDVKWKVNTKYGNLDITINLSKPEKDPKAIAAAKLIKQTGYPKCLLCKENEGYAGRINHPSRDNHRIIKLNMNNEDWYFQYSPYVYYNEHCIVFSGKHSPMKIDKNTFIKLFDFIKLFPHYILGSNADLPIVGGSILTHDHFQGGNYEFPMAKAEIKEKFSIQGFEDVEVGIVNWPMSVIRLSCENEHRIIELADRILEKWRNYTDESAFIFAETDGEKHNTITPIARKKKEKFELDLVLRNNITTDEFPFGVYHPHEKLHHIKKENIGLIEVMGVAILPSRLKEEMMILKQYILDGNNILENDKIAKHYDWICSIKEKYSDISESNIDEILKTEIGNVFLQVLEDAGVYKNTEEGLNNFKKFLNQI